MSNDLKQKSCSRCFLVEEAKDLATSVLAPGLLVVHDAERGRQHNVPKLRQTSKKQNNNGERIIIGNPKRN